MRPLLSSPNATGLWRLSKSLTADLSKLSSLVRILRRTKSRIDPRLCASPCNRLELSRIASIPLSDILRTPFRIPPLIRSTAAAARLAKWCCTLEVAVLTGNPGNPPLLTPIPLPFPFLFPLLMPRSSLDVPFFKSFSVVVSVVSFLSIATISLLTVSLIESKSCKPADFSATFRQICCSVNVEFMSTISAGMPLIKCSRWAAFSAAWSFIDFASSCFMSFKNSLVKPCAAASADQRCWRSSIEVSMFLSGRFSSFKISTCFAVFAPASLAKSLISFVRFDHDLIKSSDIPLMS